jgi:hypothetical protein
MTRLIKFTAAALLTLAAMPALADGEGTFQPAQVASPAARVDGRSYQAYQFQGTRTPGTAWNGPVASPAQGRSSGSNFAAGTYNTGSNG